MKIALIQDNFCVGDVRNNIFLMLRHVKKAVKGQADLVVFPELAICGYPPEDLLLSPGFLFQVMEGMQYLRERVPSELHVLFGMPWMEDSLFYNSAVHLHGGRVEHVYFKNILPNFGVFDEKRHFTSGTKGCAFKVGSTLVGVTICEDLWHAEPVQKAMALGVDVIVNINASPFEHGKLRKRQEMLRACCSMAKVPVCYVNLVGAQDGLVFDGASMVYTSDAHCVFQAPSFVDGQFVLDLSTLGSRSSLWVADGEEGKNDGMAALWSAIVLGIRDYVYKNGFSGCLVAVSGGIDSALTLALAVDAVGYENVQGVFMPSCYTAQMSGEDARALCCNLGVDLQEVSIDEVCFHSIAALRSITKVVEGSLTHQNVQARARAILVMGLSNAKGILVLATSNKSEAAVGYATLYGDMCGALMPLLDIYKTQVYELALYRNQRSDVIPKRTVERPPSAELKGGQKDSDTLPKYPLLDKILRGLLEECKGVEEIADSVGCSSLLVEEVTHLVYASEYKRRQAAPGIKLSSLSFGKERRYPITNSCPRNGGKNRWGAQVSE